MMIKTLVVMLCFLVVGCTGPFYPENVVIRVLNQTHQAGTFHYEGQGTSGDKPISSCGHGNGATADETDFSLGSGTWQVTISAATSSTFAVTSPTTDLVDQVYLIRADGRIEQVSTATGNQTEIPTPSPGCS